MNKSKISVLTLLCVLFLPLALLALAPACQTEHAEEETGAEEPSLLGEEYADLKVGEVERGEIQVVLHEVGVIEPVKEVEVKSVLSGKIVRLYVEPGDSVRADQQIALLEPGLNQSRDLSSIQSAQGLT